jgi:hypothetical protein
VSTEIKTDDIIFNFFKQLCDEKNDDKCLDLGKNWIAAMEHNLSKLEANLEEIDKTKHKANIESNKNHLNSLKDKTALEWREYATQCMIEILNYKK